ncbi:MAG: transglutaminase domain-containing protein [Chitinophagaceae bacterium]|nr:transglutaminase domain-containing protein [Chitinophagaceae bacterium]
MFENDKYHHLKRIIITIFGVLTVLPLAPLINRYIPPIMIGSWNFDLLVSTLLAGLFTFFIFRLFHSLVIPVLIMLVAVILYNSLTNGRGFGTVISDYQVMVKSNWGKKEQKETDLIVMPSFFEGPLARTVKNIESKVDHRDSIVRNFAVAASLKYFDEYYPKYGPMVRALSLFKTINTSFKYVSDSERDEYFATPKETILNGLGGDCDDHSILMVSAMKAIGVHTRMVLTEGHLYPEMFCGDEANFDKINTAIMNLFSKEIKGNIYYHEENGEYWLNLDYSAHYPGGPYVSEKAFAIINP